MKWLNKLINWLFNWGLPDPEYTDPDCPHCRGLGYDASGYACTCVKEMK